MPTPMSHVSNPKLFNLCFFIFYFILCHLFVCVSACIYVVYIHVDVKKKKTRLINMADFICFMWLGF